MVVKYSGGTDSTAATVMVANQFDEVHLVTYKHSGIRHIGNSEHHLEKLRELYGKDKFVHVIIDMDKLFKEVTYSRYTQNVRRYGFFNLTTCGLCKLAMHVRTILYCLELGIDHVVDGANVNSSHFPAQMKEVIEALRILYKGFGITFTNPVYNYGFPDDIDWLHKTGLSVLTRKPERKEIDPKKETTGQVLYRKGILEEENVKGTATDRRMQPLCFQLTLLNLFALSYYIPRHGMDAYREKTARFYKEKIDYYQERIREYLREGPRSELGRLLDT